MQSPMCTHCEGVPPYNLTEVDYDNGTIGKHEFYQKYLSKSLPLVLRNAAKDWGLYKGIKESSARFNGRESGLNEWLASLFAAPLFDTTMKM